jgi:hypothetical protein
MSIITKIKSKVVGRDYNFFQKVTVTGAIYGSSSSDGYTVADGYNCDLFITFPTAGIIFHTEGTATTSVIEYSFNGHTTHGELIPATANVAGRNTITFLNRKVTAIWFRVKSGSTGPVVVSVEAWGD